MTEFLPDTLPNAYLLPMALAIILPILWLINRRRGRSHTFASVTKAIAYECITNLVIPSSEEGEIQIDHLILTSEGLLIIDVKEVTGTIFGSDKMQDWKVIGKDRHFTFTNPQQALYDRMAAVRKIVRQVPVTGRILFLDGALFSKGVPGLVCNLEQLLTEFDDKDKAGAKVKVEAFRPHWELLVAKAEPAPLLSSRRRASVV